MWRINRPNNMATSYEASCGLTPKEIDFKQYEGKSIFDNFNLSYLG